jgi:predicted esterase
VLIANGKLDGYSPADKNDAMVKEFRQYGATVQVMLHNGGHTISHEHVKAIAADLAD